MDKEIIAMITSEDYRFRIVGEYVELCVRMEKLKEFLDYARGRGKFAIHRERILLFERQYKVMKEYRDILFERMKIVLHGKDEDEKETANEDSIPRDIQDEP